MKIYMIARWYCFQPRGDRARLHIAGVYVNQAKARAHAMHLNAIDRKHGRVGHELKPDGSLRYCFHVISYKVRDVQECFGIKADDYGVPTLTCMQPVMKLEGEPHA